MPTGQLSGFHFEVTDTPPQSSVSVSDVRSVFSERIQALLSSEVSGPITGLVAEDLVLTARKGGENADTSRSAAAGTFSGQFK